MDSQSAEKNIPSYETEAESDVEFPPIPISDKLQHRIITNYCEDMNPANFHESGCAVCGGLTLIKSSVPTLRLVICIFRAVCSKDDPEREKACN